MKKLYRTEQKKIIYDFLFDNEDKFVSAEDILDFLKKNNQEVGLTTIYRYLNYLEENNSVRTEIRNHTKYFQYITDECCRHFHLKCKNCGKTVHLDCKEFEDVNEHIINEHKFKIDHNTIIYGICKNCSG